MTSVFIGGSRRVVKLDDEVKDRIDRIIEKRFPVLVGDANGADRAVQSYLASKRYELVELFCSQGVCRNNIGGWPVHSVPVATKRKDFQFFAAKDRAMAAEASHGLMLWDGESAGTAMNAYRLTQANKMVAVYVAPTHSFFELRSVADWPEFLARCSPALRHKIESEISAERGEANRGRQQLELATAIGK